jgi:hypothetical protein
MGSNLQMLLGRVRGRGEHVRAVFSNLKLSGKKVQIDRHEPKTPSLLFLRENSYYYYYYYTTTTIIIII